MPQLLPIIHVLYNFVIVIIANKLFKKYLFQVSKPQVFARPAVSPPPLPNWVKARLTASLCFPHHTSFL